MARLHRGSNNPKGGLVIIGLAWLVTLVALLVLSFTGLSPAARAKGSALAPLASQRVPGSSRPQSPPAAQSGRSAPAAQLCFTPPPKWAPGADLKRPAVPGKRP